MTTARFAKPLPTFFLGKTAANARISQFMDSKHILLSTDLRKTDTKSIWYSFEHIQNLFKELVFLNADGLRIYFGEYDAKHPDFPGQLCLVMVPTRLNEETLGHEDVIMEEDIDFSERPGSDSFISEENSKAFNYGAPCPTICPLEDEMKYPFPTS